MMLPVLAAAAAAHGVLYVRVGPTCRAEPDGGVVIARERAAVLVTPPKLAVTVTLWGALIVPAVALKVTEEAAAGTATEAGTASAVLLSEAARVPAEGAGCERVAVQVADAPDAKEVGLHASDANEAAGGAVGATRETVAVLETAP